MTDAVVVSDFHSGTIKRVQYGFMQHQHGPITPQRAFAGEVQSHAFGKFREQVVPIAVGQVAGGNLRIQVPAVEGDHAVHDASGVEGHV